MKIYNRKFQTEPNKKLRSGFFQIFLISLWISNSCFSQDNYISEKKSIQNIIDSFFEALEKQDTVLFKNIVFTNGQIWVVRHRNDSIIQSVRTFSDDIKRFNPQTVIHEKPLAYDIKVHNEIAMAWVPYTLDINDTFSHCGIDIFNLLKINGNWKIVNATYSVEPKGCEAIKKEYNLK